MLATRLEDVTYARLERYWAEFGRYAAARNVSPLAASPVNVALFLVFCRLSRQPPLANATLLLVVQALNDRFSRAGLASPARSAEVARVLGALRKRYPAQLARVAALTLAEMRALSACFPDNLAGRRNRAIFWCAYAGLFRMAEALGLRWADLVFAADCLHVYLDTSKTQKTALLRGAQFHSGEWVEIPRSTDRQVCCVAMLEDLRREVLPRPSDPVFFTTRGECALSTAITYSSVVRGLKRAATAAGLHVRVAGHTPRRSGATALAAAGSNPRVIEIAGRWVPGSKTVHSYIEVSRRMRSRIHKRLGLSPVPLAPGLSRVPRCRATPLPRPPAATR